MSEKFRALVIESNIDRRMRLKQATMAVPRFAPITPVNTIAEASSQIEKGVSPFNIIFLSDRLDKEEMDQFIVMAKEKECSQDAAFVLIVPTQEDLSVIIARQTLAGVDGFLAEPYSVQSLSDIADLAAKIRAERSEARKIAAFRFLVKQVVEQMNLIAQLRAYQRNILKPMRKLKVMTSAFENLDNPMRDLYYRLTIEEFENAPLPAPLLSDEYKGASQRVRVKLEEKVLAKIEQRATAD
ncbi:MAG: hypothetical protein KDD70_06500 [Bdellovibrionales bacterium]|nr:hypothetical protein [Bdellovibrionales bacterium]